MEHGDPGCEIEGVNGFGGWIQQEVGDVGCAYLMFECGLATVEGEFPKACAFAE